MNATTAGMTPQEVELLRSRKGRKCRVWARRVWTLELSLVSSELSLPAPAPQVLTDDTTFPIADLNTAYDWTMPLGHLTHDSRRKEQDLGRCPAKLLASYLCMNCLPRQQHRSSFAIRSYASYLFSALSRYWAASPLCRRAHTSDYCGMHSHRRLPNHDALVRPLSLQLPLLLRTNCPLHRSLASSSLSFSHLSLAFAPLPATPRCVPVESRPRSGQISLGVHLCNT